MPISIKSINNINCRYGKWVKEVEQSAGMLIHNLLQLRMLLAEYQVCCGKRVGNKIAHLVGKLGINRSGSSVQ